MDSAQRPNVVALIANDRYFPGAFAAAASIQAAGLFEHTSILILHPPGTVSGHQRNWLECANPRIQLLEIDVREFLPIELSSWDTVLAPVFLRFALPEILSTSRKILYIDSDILALRSVDSAFDIDFQGKLVAAAHDDLVAGLVGYKPSWIAYRDGLGVPIEMPYLNCGVLLMNAVAWRERDVKKTLIDTYFANRERCRYFDQSAINLFLKGEFAPLSPAWNFQQNYQAIGAEDIVKPRLVHFAGSAKPWRSDGFVFERAYRQRYRDILGPSPFRVFFEPYWRINVHTAKEAWRSVTRLTTGREIQSGIRKANIPLLRQRLVALLASRKFVDIPAPTAERVPNERLSRQDTTE